MAASSSLGPQLESVHSSSADPGVRSRGAIPAAQCASDPNDDVPKVRRARNHANDSGLGECERAARQIRGSTVIVSSRCRPDGQQYRPGISDGGSGHAHRPLSNALDRLPQFSIWFSNLRQWIANHRAQRSADIGSSTLHRINRRIRQRNTCQLCIFGPARQRSCISAGQRASDEYRGG
jgi:hypothetical protein